jgi:hypothetical protein
MSQEMIERLFPLIKEISPSATLGEEGEIRIKFNNVIGFISTTKGNPIESLPTSLKPEETWFLFTFTSAMTGKVKPKALKQIREYIASGAGTDYKVFIRGDDFFQLDVISRISSRAAFAVPDYVKEVFLEMADYAEMLSRLVQRTLSILSPVETINNWEEMQAKED